MIGELTIKVKRMERDSCRVEVESPWGSSVYPGLDVRRVDEVVLAELARWRRNAWPGHTLPPPPPAPDLSAEEMAKLTDGARG